MSKLLVVVVAFPLGTANDTEDVLITLMSVGQGGKEILEVSLRDAVALLSIAPVDTAMLAHVCWPVSEDSVRTQGSLLFRKTGSNKLNDCVLYCIPCEIYLIDTTK